jgi:hypothetical protein
MRRLALAICLTVFLACSAKADEGMWMPEQIPALANRLKALGFQGDINAFADLTGFPMGAVVSLGGCSASFVSPEGLIVTNHHCVQGALQFNSKPDRNLMKNGFLARTREEELWAGPGSRVYVTVALKDVTNDIMGNIDAGLSDRERFDLVERRVKAQTAACEMEGLRCTIVPFFDGLKWYQISQLEIQDVRLVYAPAAGIGNFGGETDNWQWPRHTGDFSFYRAYVAKDGKPAPHAEDNVPFKPQHHLKVSTKGASPGELVFVAGYPGRTFRLNTFGDVKENVAWRLPRAIKRSTDRIAILEKLAQEDAETAIRVSTAIRGLNNGLTKNKGVLSGLVKGGLLAQKEAAEKEFIAWIDSNPERRENYGGVLPALNALELEAEKTRERDALVAELTFGAGTALGAAQTLHRFSVEMPKPDADRDPAFQKRNWTRIREALDRVQRSLDRKADRALMRYTLADVAQLAADQRIDALDQEIGLKPGMASSEALRLIDGFLDKLLAGTQLYKKEARLSLIGKSTAELAGTKDSMLMLAAALYPLQEAIRNKNKERSGASYRLGPRYASALLAKNGGLVAPDANSTLRVTYGVVKGVEPRDGIYYLPQTTLQGILQKATGEGEFNAPQVELQAIEALRAGKSTPYLDAKVRDVPVDFLSTVDTTGGNSGSATLNSKGELVGLLFDGTYDTVASDYLFDKEKTRSIHVDTRNMLWVLTEVDKAFELLHEMGISSR